MIINSLQLLKKFIVDNELTFEEGVRNSQAVVLCGYANFLGISNPERVKVAIEEICVNAKDYQQEIEKVFAFAETKSYGKYWKTEEAKKKYIF